MPRRTITRGTREHCPDETLVLCVLQPKSLDRAEELFAQADKDKDGKLKFAELRDVLNAASKEYSHLEEHSRFLDA